MHYAICGEIAAEIIFNRADVAKDNMGLTSWEGNIVKKEDVNNAKNYLSNNELKSLEKIVTMYLDHAEEMANEHIPMHMKDWTNALDGFLKFKRKDLLIEAGKISHSLAQQKAFKEYEIFN